MRPAIFPDAKRPLVLAHRGLSGIAPENTMAAFKLARKMGMPGVELDVHLTKDGKLVVFHDHWTGRLAGARAEDGTVIPPGPWAKGKGLKLEDSTYDELRQIDIGSWKGKEYSGERIFLLAELFEEFGDSFYYDIELKNGVRADYGLEAKTAETIRAAKGIIGHCVASSFNPVSMARFKTLMPEVPTGIIWCLDDDDGLPKPLQYGLGSWIGHVDFLKPEHVKVTPLSRFRWRTLAGKEVLPWTVDDAAVAKRILGLGCSGVISNVPHTLGLL